MLSGGRGLGEAARYISNIGKALISLTNIDQPLQLKTPQDATEEGPYSLVVCLA